MGQSGSTIVNKTVGCHSCREKLSEDLYYKYQLKSTAPICKSCLIKQRRNKITTIDDFIVLEPQKSEKKVRRKKSKRKSEINLYGLYIVSTPDQINKNTFKVGIHSGTQRKLISRYHTYFPDILILFYFPSEKADQLEKEVFNKLENNRVCDGDNHHTEWIILPLSDIIATVFSIIESDGYH